jgi:hypothetical protein
MCLRTLREVGLVRNVQVMIGKTGTYLRVGETGGSGTHLLRFLIKGRSNMPEQYRACGAIEFPV